MGFYNPKTTDEEWLASLPAYERRMRRMWKACAQGSHTAKEWKALKATFNGRCVRCGGDGPLTRDHVLAVSRGGCDCIANIQPLCQNCNSAKCARDGDYRYEADPLWAVDLVFFLRRSA